MHLLDGGGKIAVGWRSAPLIAEAMLFVLTRSAEILLQDRYPEYTSHAARTRRIVPGLF